MFHWNQVGGSWDILLMVQIRIVEEWMIITGVALEVVSELDGFYVIKRRCVQRQKGFYKPQKNTHTERDLKNSERLWKGNQTEVTKELKFVFIKGCTGVKFCFLSQV